MNFEPNYTKKRFVLFEQENHEQSKATNVSL